MSEEKMARRPVIDPVLMALRSRRVMIALAALFVGGLVSAVPVLAPVEGELLTLVITLALGLIGGYSVEDAARAGRSELPDRRELIKEAVDAVFDAAERRASTSKPPDDPAT